jgi:hypothetical protein
MKSEASCLIIIRYFSFAFNYNSKNQFFGIRRFDITNTEVRLWTRFSRQPKNSIGWLVIYSDNRIFCDNIFVETNLQKFRVFWRHFKLYCESLWAREASTFMTPLQAKNEAQNSYSQYIVISGMGTGFDLCP